MSSELAAVATRTGTRAEKYLKQTPTKFANYTGADAAEKLAQSDVHVVCGVFERDHQLVPHFEIGSAGEDVEFVADDLVEHLVMQHGRDFVDAVGVHHRNDRIGLYSRLRHQLVLSILN